MRDSGIVHALPRIPDREALFGHPVVGSSWEGFVIDNLLSVAPDSTLPGSVLDFFSGCGIPVGSSVCKVSRCKS